MLKWQSVCKHLKKYHNDQQVNQIYYYIDEYYDCLQYCIIKQLFKFVYIVF